MRTPAEMVRWWARRRPELAATWYQGHSTTWAGLDAATSGLAAGLIRELGIKPGDHVAILDKNSDAYFELMLALDKAGAIATPVNWRLTAPEVAKIVGDAQATLIVTSEEFRSNADAAGVRVIGFEELPRDADGSDPHRDDERNTCWQLYTSGTTGLPKGSMLSGANLFGNLGNAALESPDLREGGRGMVAMPLYHIGGWGGGVGGGGKGAPPPLLRGFVSPEGFPPTIQ